MAQVAGQVPMAHAQHSILNLPALPPRPLFLYGTLMSLPLLAWLLTGDSRQINIIAEITQPNARIYGFKRVAVNHSDYPALVPAQPSDIVQGILLRPRNGSERKKADDFEGEIYQATEVEVFLEGGQEQDPVWADVYIWVGDRELLLEEEWDPEYFAKNRLEDWLDLFAGMEMIGEEDSPPIVT